MTGLGWETPISGLLLWVDGVFTVEAAKLIASGCFCFSKVDFLLSNKYLFLASRIFIRRGKGEVEKWPKTIIRLQLKGGGESDTF